MSSERGSRGDLFGRGMIYVVVWSMQMVVATVVSPVLAHVLPVAAFGSLAAAIALYQLLLIVIVFGLDQALAVQRVEDVDDDHRARGLVASGLVASIIVTGLAAATSLWWGPALGFTSQHLLLLTLGWTLPGAAVLLVLSLLQAEDRLKRFSVVSLISTVGSQLVGIILLFVVGRTAETYAIGGVVGQCTALAVGLFWVKPRWRGLLDLEAVKRALQLGMPLVLTSLAEYVLTAGDRFLIQRWLGAVQVARYQVAFTVGNVVTLLLTFTNRAWLPRLKSIVDPDERWKVIGASRDGVYVLAGWAAFGITIAAPALLRVFAPESYGLDTLLAVVAVVGLGALPVAASVASGQQLVTIRWSSPLAWGAAAAVGGEGRRDGRVAAGLGHQRRCRRDACLLSWLRRSCCGSPWLAGTGWRTPDPGCSSSSASWSSVAWVRSGCRRRSSGTSSGSAWRWCASCRSGFRCADFNAAERSSGDEWPRPQTRNV
jgi:O-antigen/teichoic acid export membrane protein